MMEKTNLKRDISTMAKSGEGMVLITDSMHIPSLKQSGCLRNSSGICDANNHTP